MLGDAAFWHTATVPLMVAVGKAFTVTGIVVGDAAEQPVTSVQLTLTDPVPKVDHLIVATFVVPPAVTVPPVTVQI